jgi:CxxC-x17-CxxC domain-containing protein
LSSSILYWFFANSASSMLQSKSSFSLGHYILFYIIPGGLKYWMTQTLTSIIKRGEHPMSFEDKSIQCSDCGATFTFSVEEQELFQSRGYTNEPKRCPSCRQARKSERFGNDSYNRGPRQMFQVTCAECGKDTEVPFEPRTGRPVYCSDCYRKVRTNG